MQKARKKGKIQRKRRKEYDSNRSFNKEPRGGHRFWCWGCDRNLVNDIGKCSVCGKIDGKNENKNRKPYPLGD